MTQCRTRMIGSSASHSQLMNPSTLVLSLNHRTRERLTEMAFLVQGRQRGRQATARPATAATIAILSPPASRYIFIVQHAEQG